MAIHRTWLLLCLITASLLVHDANCTGVSGHTPSNETLQLISSAPLQVTPLDDDVPAAPSTERSVVKEVLSSKSNVSANITSSPLDARYSTADDPSQQLGQNSSAPLNLEALPETGPRWNTSTPPTHGSELHSAVIVEDRPAQALLTVISYMRRQLPNTTLFHVFHSTANHGMLRAKFTHLIESGNMRLTNLEKFNITHVTRHSSNWLYLNEEFWKDIHGENILLFQMDSCICSKSRHTLQEFVGRYDFIGGPYANQQRSRHQNGGFSLRVRSKMIEAIAQVKKRWEKEFTNEDIFFSVMAAEAGVIKPAPVPVAQSFCIDSWFYDSPFAVHKITARLRQFTRMKKPVATLMKNCPEIQLMVKLQNQLQRGK